jgi:hypothetical protein
VIKLVCFIHRRPDRARADFQRHWRERHGPLIAGIPELRRHVARYEQNQRLESDYSRDGHGVLRDGHSDSPDGHSEGSSRNAAEFDGATVMWFESMREYEAFAAEPLYAERIAPDEAEFMDRARTMYFFSEEAEPKIGGLPEQQRGKVKRLALLTRKPGLSISEFHAHWSGPHGDLFKHSPALRSLDAFYAGAEGEPFEEIVVPDEERFLDRAATRVILCEPAHVVF